MNTWAFIMLFYSKLKKIAIIHEKKIIAPGGGKSLLSGAVTF